MTFLFLAFSFFGFNDLILNSKEKQLGQMGPNSIFILTRLEAALFIEFKRTCFLTNSDNRIPDLAIKRCCNSLAVVAVL